MSEMLIKASKGASYNIIVEKSFKGLAVSLENLGISDKKVCIISNDTVFNTYGNEVKGIFEERGCEVVAFLSKISLDGDICRNINDGTEFLKNNGIGENDIVVSLGGSVIVDLASYISATYDANVELINIPTSVSSMADTAVDGKAGSILEAFSDINRVIKFPKLVYCNILCIDTLNDRDYYSGFAYVMRNAIVKSASIYEWLIDKLYEISDRDEQIVNDMIEQCIEFKKIYMEKDPMCNKGNQMLMEFGSTAGFALYKVKKSEMTLGECLTLGIIVAAHISYKKNMLSFDEYLEIRDMFVPFNLPISVENIDIDEVISLIHEDKKKDEMGKCFVLLKKIGRATIDRGVNDEEIRAALEEIRFSDDDYVIE